jgi:DNA-binding transcriptional LysR family regulator
MDIRQLEYITHLADTQVLTKTADEMFISPSALSQHVSKLENELGTLLFKRVKGAWPLTEAGRAYVEASREIIQRYRQMRKSVNDIIDCESGLISMGISSNKASRMFASVFPRFNKKFPNITIKLSDGRTRDINAQAEKGLLDLVFSTTGIESPGLICQTLLHERFVLSVPRTHRLAHLADKAPAGKLATVELTLFRGEHFMLSNPSMTIRVITDRMFAEAGFTPDILFECNSTPTLYTLVESGYGVSIIPMGNISSSSSSVYFLTKPLGEWDNIVAYAKGSRLSRAEEYFISLAREYFATQFNYINI